jgi:endonuclease/exonuclease/phosphatase family metal-dependent hydrolase
MRSTTPRRRAMLLPLFALALLTTGGCTGHYALVRRPNAEPSALSWFGPSLSSEQARLTRWSSVVGPPIVVARSGDASPTDSLVLISWNVALGAGDIGALVDDVRCANPDSAVVLLLQEAYRAGPEVPSATAGDISYAGRLGGAAPRDDIEAAADKIGFNLYYVPSMRNGSPTATDEDRGNAILSSLPLQDLTALELPFERQRRVAVAATTIGRTTRGSSWGLRFVSAHLDNMVGPRRLWFLGSTFARTRQARALVEYVRDEDAAVLGGDFNTWFGFADPAFAETRRAFPDTHVTDRRPTFRNLLRLDHVFFRLPDGWQASVERARQSYGSDHWPLIATIRIR